MADERYFHDIASGRRRGAAARLCRGLLKLASLPYGWAASLRRQAYRKGLMRSYRAEAPVISIGNVTAGGTGKTPLAVWLVKWLQDEGRSPAVLTRGYKAVAGRSDEAELLRRLTGAEVVVKADRVAGARAAVAVGADVLVMDDGFQHLRLRRDMDIVTIDATCPFGHAAVLPRGLLREPLGALRLADAVVLTRCDQVDEQALAAVRRRLVSLAPQAAVAESAMAPARVRGFDGSIAEPDSLAGAAVWAFCGVGNPEAFCATLAALGARVVGHSSFNDHHAYTERDVRRLVELARAAEASLVTTAKDAVRLERLAQAAEVRWLEIELRFLQGEAALRELLRGVLLIASGPAGR